MTFKRMVGIALTPEEDKRKEQLKAKGVKIIDIFREGLKVMEAKHK